MQQPDGATASRKRVKSVKTSQRTALEAINRREQIAHTDGDSIPDLLSASLPAHDDPEAAERYRTLFHLVPVAVYTCDADGVIDEYNQQAVELWGRKPRHGDRTERYCGPFKIFYPDGQVMPHDACPMARVLRGDTLAERETEILVERPDGTPKYVRAHPRALKNARGDIVGAVNCFYDITEYKQMEEALRASETQLAIELADTQQVQRISSQLIQEGNLNALYEQILAAAIAVMHSDMGSIQLLYPERSALKLLAWKGFDPASAAFWEWVRVDSGSVCGVALRTGERIVVADIERCDYVTGTWDLDFYRRSNIQAAQSTPLVSRSGHIVGMISTHWRTPHQPAERELRLLDVLARQAADLIERKQAEEASAHLAAIVTSADDAIASKTLEGIVTSWNASAERMFGYTAQEMIGQSILRLIPQDRYDEEDFILSRIRAGKRVEHFETVRVAKDGHLIEVSLTISPIRDSTGTIIGASKIVRDITERKRADEALRASERRKDEFLGVASHELRTPLTSITANVRMAERALRTLLQHLPQTTTEAGADDNREMATRLERAHLLLERTDRQVARMDRLVGDLLDVSRIQAGKLDMRPEPCDLLAIVREAVEGQRATWPQRDITIDLPQQANLPLVADADRIGQIITNYLSNALKYSPPDQPVTVKVRAAEGQARVEVRDQGPGLTSEQQKLLFERFSRVPGIELRNGSGVGLGLGLYICRTIVERHDGALGVESEPGVGSTFWFTLPLAPASR